MNSYQEGVSTFSIASVTTPSFVIYNVQFGAILLVSVCASVDNTTGTVLASVAYIAECSPPLIQRAPWSGNFSFSLYVSANFLIFIFLIRILVNYKLLLRKYYYCCYIVIIVVVFRTFCAFAM